MNHFFLNHNTFNYHKDGIVTGRIFFWLLILTTPLLPFILTIPVQASEPKIKIVDVWVEEGFLFHVTLDSHPNNSDCVLNGEGLIEFEVLYTAQSSSGMKSAFGVAIWYPGPNPDDWITTHGETMGPQAFCTEFSPCLVHEVNIVNTWCPDIEGPFFQE